MHSTTRTTAAFYLAMDTHQNCLNKAALLSIQRYTNMTEEFTGTLNTHTLFVRFITMMAH